MASSEARSFGQADHGIAWAASKLPGGSMKDGKIRAKGLEVKLARLTGAKGEDDYAIEFAGEAVKVKSNSAVGTISGLLKLGDMLRAGKKQDLVQNLQFRTRNYKHELKFTLEGPRAIVNYTDEIWEALFQQMVSHQFNGVVFYAHYHPFEYILDYKEYPQAASKPAAFRAAIRKAVNRGLAIAHKYGLKTFIQHYVGHFTEQLAEAYSIPTTGRLASIEHPEIYRYIRYCYKAIFEQCPDLDGLYFNFESTPDAAGHVLQTAIPVFNKMKVKPFMICRLWNYCDIDGMKRILAEYKGRVAVSHKIADTNDTYYLPEADSRVMEWKKHIPKLEWLYCVGPCHNCGTNLCDQLWGDYEFMQKFFADAKAKGADSIGFHTINEFFSPDLPDPKGVFPQHEKDMATFNRMHLQAAVDFFNNEYKTPAQRAATMAKRAGVGQQAGKDLLEAVWASSQQVLLVYQQFCHTSAMDGFLNSGRFMYTQEPFMFFPATEHNNQASRLPWRLHFTNTPWVDKTIDTKVAPDNFLQRVIDYVNPAKTKATRNPQKLADLLEKYGRQSFEAAKRFAKAAPKDLSARLEGYLAQNAALGQYIRHELLAAIQLYSLYFAKSKAHVISALKNGLSELEQMVPYVADKKSKAYKIMMRVTMLDRMDPQAMIAPVKEALALAESTDFPLEAFAAFADSHRLYNECRRHIRPYRRVNTKALDIVRTLCDQSVTKAQKALKFLKDKKYEALADNVRSWIWFVENEKARSTPPTAQVPSEPNGQYFTLQHDECFHMGRNYMDDFLSFFKPVDYLLPAGISFQVWHTPKELVLSLREAGVNYAQRLARWEKFKNEGSCAFIYDIFVDTDNDGEVNEKFIVWPRGSSVSAGRKPNIAAKTEFSHDATSWQTTVRIPFTMLGGKPSRGKVWGLNVTSNPAVIRNYGYTWAPQYDGAGNARLFGKIKFE